MAVSRFRLAVILIVFAVGCGGPTEASISPAPETQLISTPSPSDTAPPMATPTAAPTQTQRPLPTPTPPEADPAGDLPPPVVSTATPDPSLTARQRIDAYWAGFDSVECMGMVAPESLEAVADESDLIAIGQAVGAREWDDPHYVEPAFLVTFQISQVLSGEAYYRTPGVIQIVGTYTPPDTTISDIDQLLLLRNREQLERELNLRTDPGDGFLYYLTYGYMSVYANVDGRVVTPEYRAVKRMYGDSIFSTALDGTKFDALVGRVTETSAGAFEPATALAQHGYFAC